MLLKSIACDTLCLYIFFKCGENFLNIKGGAEVFHLSVSSKKPEETFKCFIYENISSTIYAWMLHRYISFILRLFWNLNDLDFISALLN